MDVVFSGYKDSDRKELLKLWERALPLDAVTVDTLETRVLLDENFDPSTFLIARSDGRMVGFVVGTYARRAAMGDHDPRGDRSWITAFGIDPEADLELVGAPLLEELLSRFRRFGKKECWISTYPTGYFTPGLDIRAYDHLIEFFLTHGFKKHREALSMDAPIALFEVPARVKETEEHLRGEGIEIRPYRRDDLLVFLDFLEQTMPLDWVRVERTNLKKIATAGFRPDQITLVLDNGMVVGYCQFEGSHFGPFGVAEKYQGRGIGTVLLARTLERMRQQGHHDAWVLWTDDTAAKVYSKFGFAETRRFAILMKDL